MVNDGDSINQLIPSEAVQNVAAKLEGGWGTSIGVDVARYGDDRTVFTVLKAGNIDLIESYPQTSITEVATRTIQLMNDYGLQPEYVGIDAVGLGAGVVDLLKSQNYNVTEIQGGAKPEETQFEEAFKPYNLRSQLYYQLRKDLMEGRLGNLKHEGLKLELQVIKYEVNAERTVRVVGKEAIKKLLGTSPDFADSLAYANWAKTYRGPFNDWLPICGGR